MTAIDFRFSPKAHTGYGRMGLDMAAALQAAGVTFTEDADVRVIATNITGIDGWWSHQRRVLWTMWETDRLPEAYQGTFDSMDQILVPCEANRVAFAEQHPNVEVLHLGIGAEWQPTPRPTSGPTVFLAGGRGWKRKGLDVTLRAFCDLDPPDAELWLRVEGGIPNDPLLAHPGVRIIERTNDMPGLFAKAHCFVAASRGEGFGLMPLQAMAQGCPAILTGGHGHGEFAHHGYEIATSMVPSTFTGIGNPGMWWEPDFDELRAMIEAVADAPDAAGEDALARAADIGAEFAWDPERLMTLTGAGGTAVKGGWIPDREALVHPVRVTEYVRADIGPHQVNLRPGVDYLHAWDVKRTLHESGVLDPAVWDPAGLEAVLR